MVCCYLCYYHIAHKNHFFRLCQQDESSVSKVKFGQAINCYKKVLGVAKLAFDKKTNESSSSQKLGCCDFLRITSSVLNKSKSVIPPLLNCPKVLSSASNKATFLAKNFSKNTILDDSGISVPGFSTRTNLNLHNIPVISKVG